jgi:uncharacterized protein YutE (UPF0331/DUF86 family)
MEDEKFIEMQLSMIKNHFGLAQIKNEVYRYIFRKYVGNVTIDAMIEMCMELYAEIIKRMPCERCKKLEFMIENGLGWKDMENDCT